MTVGTIATRNAAQNGIRTTVYNGPFPKAGSHWVR